MDDAGSHTYNLKAMVRVLGMAMNAEPDKNNQDALITYCALLEEMLPDEGQLELEVPSASRAKAPKPPEGGLLVGAMA
jgi:hypothetical protein